MKTLFYAGVIALTIFEILNVYFIMPMPGSQRFDTIDIAYFLYSNRWVIRIFLLVLIAAGTPSAFSVKRKWLPFVPLLILGVVAYYFNFTLTADQMFKQPNTIAFTSHADSPFNDSTVVIAVSHAGESKAYPMRYIVYHHQVRDTVGGKPVMVTYCSVCRTGRVFEPLVNGKPETFRLVGMDHFNAMFEDSRTKSWWRQATGEAITGDLKGSQLNEVPSYQLTAGRFFALFPFGKIMLADSSLSDGYDKKGRYEKGKSKGDLTRTDSLSWKDKSWVIGVVTNAGTKAFDWNVLKAHGAIHDQVGNTPVLIVLSLDGQSFAAYERNIDQHFELRNDTIVNVDAKYSFDGQPLNGTQPLKRLNAYQEFWHSWRTFHPDTQVADSTAHP